MTYTRARAHILKIYNYNIQSKYILHIYHLYHIAGNIGGGLIWQLGDFQKICQIEFPANVLTTITHHTLCIGIYGYCSGYAITLLHISICWGKDLCWTVTLSAKKMKQVNRRARWSVASEYRLEWSMVRFVTFTVTVPQKQDKDRKVKYHNQSC